MGEHIARHYILFDSYNWGLHLEAKLKAEKVKYVISPTPREFSASCGMSIMYNMADQDQIKDIIQKNNIQIKGFFTLEKK